MGHGASIKKENLRLMMFWNLEKWQRLFLMFQCRDKGGVEGGLGFLKLSHKNSKECLVGFGKESHQWFGKKINNELQHSKQ